MGVKGESRCSHHYLTKLGKFGISQATADHGGYKMHTYVLAIL